MLKKSTVNEKDNLASVSVIKFPISITYYLDCVCDGKVTVLRNFSCYDFCDNKDLMFPQ